MAHPRFQSGNMTTGFIAEEYPDGFHGGVLTDAVKEAMIVAATFINAVERSRETQIEGQISQPKGPQERMWVVSIGGEDVVTSIVPMDDHAVVAIGPKKRIEVFSDWVPGEPVFHASISDNDVAIEIDRGTLGWILTTDGVSMDVKVQTERAAALHKLMPEKVAADTSKFLLCPMPGLVVSVNVEVGDEVKAGQALAVVEAMKMENILRAEKDATVKAVNAKAGDSLAVDAVILEFE
ncbi:MAG: biotin/lipoyl-binding protein [Alphaproteobacteria bacterium]|nr:MAG: biotin/lipoyl-binding protein [Alphaproteobacteria bacterium]